MKIIENVTETVERDEVNEVHCNLCGEAQNKVVLPTLNASGGWASTFPPDLELWSLDICEHCVAALFLVCTIPPDVYNVATGEEEDEPGGKMAALLAGQWCGGDSRAVIKRLEWIVSSATRRVAREGARVMRVAFIAAHALASRIAIRLSAAARIPYGCSVTFQRGPWCIDPNTANRIVWDNGRDDVWRRIDRGTVFVVAQLYGPDNDDVVVLLTADEVIGEAAVAMVRRADGDEDE